MNSYNFDKIIKRTRTGAVKVDALKTVVGDDNLIPLGVADMDFETPQFITDALKERLNHSLYGYSREPENYWPIVIDWLKEQHGREVQPKWITYITGIVKGIGMVIKAFLNV